MSFICDTWLRTLGSACAFYNFNVSISVPVTSLKTDNSVNGIESRKCNKKHIAHENSLCSTDEDTHLHAAKCIYIHVCFTTFQLNFFKKISSETIAYFSSIIRITLYITFLSAESIVYDFAPNSNWCTVFTCIDLEMLACISLFVMFCMIRRGIYNINIVATVDKFFQSV